MQHGVRSIAVGLLALGSVFLGVAPHAHAQFGNAWLELTQDFNRIHNPDGSVATQITTDTQEKDYTVADFDQDGDEDLLIVRKIPFGFPGKRPGFLLMNEGGVLVDRTAQYASASTTPGDTGLMLATEARDVEAIDVTGDGWLDVVYCSSDELSELLPQHKVFTHPRVLVNLGDDPNGDWLGLRHEDARIPQILVATGNGMLRWNDLTGGDVDADGDIDLYFIDFDTDENGHPEPAALDTNDRLLINDGFGFFTDETTLHMAATYSSSAYGTDCRFVDINGDGRLDIVKVSTLTESPNRIECMLNDTSPSIAPNGIGQFDTDQFAVSSGEPYAVDIADLNNDGRLDLLLGLDVVDGYSLNQGNDASGKPIWGTKVPFTFLAGSSDEGFIGHMYSIDLDLDGHVDAVTTDADVDLAGCNRRTKLFHNLGNAPSPTLREEAQQTGPGGWKSAVGWSNTYPKGVYDSAFLELDGDGVKDIVLGLCTGTHVWMSRLPCQLDLGFGGPGTASLEMCGPPLSTGNSSVLRFTGGLPNAVVVYFASTSNNPTPTIGGNTIVPFPVQFSNAAILDATGSLDLTVPGGGGDVFFYLQAASANSALPGLCDFTNALRLDFNP